MSSSVQTESWIRARIGRTSAATASVEPAMASSEPPAAGSSTPRSARTESTHDAARIAVDD
jgi:hypothetical protein